jgi:hypothetical protein
MIGLCCIMGGDPSGDPLKYFGRAFEHYSKVWQLKSALQSLVVMPFDFPSFTIIKHHVAHMMFCSTVPNWQPGSN